MEVVVQMSSLKDPQTLLALRICRTITITEMYRSILLTECIFLCQYHNEGAKKQIDSKRSSAVKKKIPRTDHYCVRLTHSSRLCEDDLETSFIDWAQHLTLLLDALWWIKRWRPTPSTRPCNHTAVCCIV